MDKTFGRGQRLKSVSQDFHRKKPENLQDQLFKISAYEYTNESIEKFCKELAAKELAAKETEDTFSSSLWKGDCHPNESQNEVVRKYEDEFPCLGVAKAREGEKIYTLDVGGEEEKERSLSRIGSDAHNKTKIESSTSSSSTDGDDYFDRYDDMASQPVSFSSAFESACNISAESRRVSQPPPKHKLNKFSIGRGQRLRMVAESIPLPTETLEYDINRAVGTEYTNQSIERFVKELAEKNDKDS